MLCLMMRRGPTPGAIFNLEADEITIGRGSKSGIVIHDNEVSRTHCRLMRLQENYEVHDLDSINGTFVNGQRVVTPWLLQHGALIELGDSITLEYGTLSPDSALAADQLPLAAETRSHFSLMMIQGPVVGSNYPLNGSLISVGRDLTNDIVIDDTEVSRAHLRLHFTQRGYLVEDLASTNGSFVNDEPLRETRCLEPNDVIRLGTMVNLEYLFREEPFASLDEETPVGRPLEINRERTLTNLYTYDAKRSTVTARSTGLEPGVLQDHLLIVYAREDWETLVAPLLVRLQDTRLNAWVDQYLSLGSEYWQVAVEQALNECWLMVLVVTPEALNSPYVKMMYRYFINENKPVIPLIYTPTPLPNELSRLRSIAYDPENSPRTFHKLIFEVMQIHQMS
ncbi:MAG: FHA domain-containing protein [Chloroflexota bacterium]